MRELRPLSQRRALVVGGYRDGSVGQAIAVELADAGWGFVETPPRDLLDVTYPDMGEAMHQLGQLDALVLSHGRTSMGPLHEQEPEVVAEVIGTNLIGGYWAMQAFVNGTKHSSWRKQILVIGSMGGARVFTNSSAYCASKAGLRHLVACAAWELDELGYDVFGLNPGNVVGTQMSRFVIDGMIRGGMTREAAEEKFYTSATRDAIRPEEVARVAAFMLSGNASYASGSNVDLPGGAR